MTRDAKPLKLASARLDLRAASRAELQVPSSDSRKGVQSVDLAFAILQSMEEAHGPLALKALAERLGMAAPKVHHYLVSLVRSGVLRQTPEGTYDLGPFALQLGLSALRRLDPVERGTEQARALRDETGEAVFVAVWGSHGPTIIRYFEGFQTVTVEARAGLVLPLATSATGHVFLTWGHAALFQPVLEAEALPPDLSLDRIEKATRAAGLGRVEGALLPRIASLSAPVFDRDGRLTLALTCLGWIGDFDVSLEGKVAATLKRHASDLSSALGFATTKA